MLFIVSKSNYAPFNIATEEYILRNIAEDVFLIYINAPSIIIGKHQNTLSEINSEYVNKHRIPVVRRLTGGGAVFHDLGNLNFSFIVTDEKEKAISFQKYTAPILDVLNSLGVKAYLEGRNDLLIDGMKFSGNAKAVVMGRVIQHGTVMFDSKIEELSKALKANPLKFKDKAVKSVRSRVTTVNQHLDEPVQMEEFIALLQKRVKQQYPDLQEYSFSEAETQGIQKLCDEKYDQWSWNYSQSPPYSNHRGMRSKAGTVEVYFEVKKGRIEGIRFFGDYFGQEDSSELEAKLTGVEHNEETLRKLLDELKVERYFGDVDAEELLGMMF